MDVIRGDHSNFVRADELDAAWKIFTPLLHAMDAVKNEEQGMRVGLPVYPYPAGSRGPDAAPAFIERCGYVRHAMDYDWKREMSESASKL